MKVLKVKLGKSSSSSYVLGLEEGWRHYKFWFLLEHIDEQERVKATLAEYIPQTMNLLYKGSYVFSEKFLVENDIQTHVRGNLLLYEAYFQDNNIVKSCVGYLENMQQTSTSVDFSIILGLIKTLNLWID